MSGSPHPVPPGSPADLAKRHAEVMDEFLDCVDRSGCRSAGFNLAWAHVKLESELSVLRGQLAAAETQPGDGRVIDADGQVDWKKGALGWRRRALKAESALAAVTTGRDEARADLANALHELQFPETVSSAPMLVRMPPSFRARIRDAITDPKARASFDGLMDWEDDVVAAFNAVSLAADRMADALQLIAEWKFFCDERVNDHPAVRFTARAALTTDDSEASSPPVSTSPGESQGTTT